MNQTMKRKRINRRNSDPAFRHFLPAEWPAFKGRDFRRCDDASQILPPENGDDERPEFLH